MDQAFDKYWILESSGIIPELCSANLEDIVKKVSDNIKFNGKRYETPLPWKQKHDLLPDNYESSKDRLISLLRRLQKNPKLLKEYDEVIRNQEEEGIIEKIPEDVIVKPGRIHYLPHHPIIRNDRETTKLRVVHDASSKRVGPSLNDCLETGPNLLLQIVDILLRFRCYKIGLIADIRKAFLNINIVLEDRDVLRFLWVKDVNDENLEIIIRRFATVLFGSTASQFLLNVVIRKHLHKYFQIDPKFVEKVLREMYVDDVVSGGHKGVAVYEFYKKIKSRMLEASLDLQKWATNDLNIQKKIDVAEKVGGNYPTEHKDKKVLGVNWELKKDEFIIDFNSIYEDSLGSKPTKRNVLKIMAKMYDPLGVSAVLVMSIKNLFQKICFSKCQWDDMLPNELLSEWFTLREAFKLRLSIPRYYFAPHDIDDVKCIQLNGFCDASQKGYAAVIYLHGRAHDNENTGSMVLCKTKIAPIKKMSVPKLELMSCMFF